jgi:hypothetical protein
MRTLLIASFILLAGVAAHGQEGQGDYDGYIEMLRSDIRTSKVAVITEVMDFTEAQASAFWPLYKDYDHELDKVNDLRVAVIKDYAKNYETMTDEKAKGLAAQWFTFHEKRTALRKTYFAKFQQVLPPAMAAKFLQLDHQISLLIDLQIAAQIPLIPAAGEVSGE